MRLIAHPDILRLFEVQRLGPSCFGIREKGLCQNLPSSHRQPPGHQVEVGRVLLADFGAGESFASGELAARRRASDAAGEMKPLFVTEARKSSDGVEENHESIGELAISDQ
jgi:hypothetical protein